MRLTKLNPETGEYEYVKKAKTLAEFQNQRKAAIQKLGFYEDIIEANFDLPDTKIGGNHHKLKVVEQSETARECKEGVDNGFSSSVTESATRAKVAREIFEEIDRMCIDTFGNFNHRVFAELKKKYTESEKDNDNT